MSQEATRRREGFVRLRTLRAFLHLTIQKPPPLDAARLDYDLFRRILAEAQRTTAGWGGRLTFVYLPAPGRYESAELRRPFEAARVKVLVIVRELGAPLVDLVDLFARQADVSGLYVPAGGHFTPRAHALAADAVLRALERGP